MDACTLCGEPTSDPPVTRAGTSGAFCCRGCLMVYRALGDADGVDLGDVRQRLRGAGLDANEKAPDALEETFLRVGGMRCATCEAFIEMMAEKVPGIYRVQASYASEMARIAYDPERLSTEDLPRLLTTGGYRAALPEGAHNEGSDQDEIARLLAGGFFALMAMMWYVVFLYPVYFGAEGFMDLDGPEGTFAFANLWAAASVVLFYTGLPLLRGAAVSLRAGRPNMDLLVTLAATSAYLYSAGAVLAGRIDVYFDVTIAIVMAVSLGGFYERRIRRRAVGHLADLTREQSDEARRLTSDGPETARIGDLAPGDRLLVKAGERIPIDGIVLEGEATTDESLVTGESVPVGKQPGDCVIGGSVLAAGALTVEVGENAQSTLDRIARLTWTALAGRSGKEQLADRLARIFVPLVLVLAAGAFGVQLALGAAWAEALLTGLAVLVVSCPCALGLATPLAVASGLRDALKRGIVIKDASVFETAPQTRTVVFDKTGTLTTGRMRLLETHGPDEALCRAHAVEQLAAHPVAEAITSGLPRNGHVASDFRSHPRGVEATVDGKRVLVGHPGWLHAEGLRVPGDLRRKAGAAERSARVPVAVGWDGAARGLLVVGDEVRTDVQSVLRQIEREECEVIVLTGDTEAAAEQLRCENAVSQVLAEVRPEAKGETVRRLAGRGPVAMVGDGSNDAPALAEADLGIAFGPTALAADAAGVVILSGELGRVPEVFRIASETRRRIRQNLAWAFLYNVVAIPLAALGAINPLFAAGAMAASSLLVVGNSARPVAANRR